MSKTVNNTNATFDVVGNAELRYMVFNPEYKVIECFIDDIQPNDVIFDVGANIGTHAILAAQHTEHPIVSFEPHPRNIERLKTNIELNSADVDIHEIALSDENGQAELLVVDPEREGDGVASLDVREKNRDVVTEPVMIETRRGDDFIQSEGLATPDIVKIDVEGAEMQVINGLEQTLSSGDVRVVYCEVHVDPGETTAIRDRLAQLGYTVTIINSRDHTYHLRATQA